MSSKTDRIVALLSLALARASSAATQGGAATFKTINFGAEVNNGNSGAAATIDWTKGQKQRLTLTAAPAVLSFVNPAGVTNILLRLLQDGGGSRTVTWPANVKWPNGNAPVLSAAPGAIDIVSLYYDGADYFGTFSLAFG